MCYLCYVPFVLWFICLRCIVGNIETNIGFCLHAIIQIFETWICFLAPSKTNILLTLTCFNKKREIELITKSQLTNMLCDTSWSFLFARKFSSSNNVTIFVDYFWWTKQISIFDVKIQNPNQLDSKYTWCFTICIIILDIERINVIYFDIT